MIYKIFIGIWSRIGRKGPESNREAKGHNRVMQKKARMIFRNRMSSI